MADHLQGALPAISLVSQQGLISAFSNDVEPSMVYAQQVYGYGKPGDVLLGLSTSGNSVNVIRAVQVAKAGDERVVMTGKSGESLKRSAMSRLPFLGKRPRRSGTASSGLSCLMSDAGGGVLCMTYLSGFDIEGRNAPCPSAGKKLTER